MSRSSTRGSVYLLHFDRRIAHAQHYLGWAVNVEARVLEHLAGRGARLVAVALERGAAVELVRTWPGVTRELERRLKNTNQVRRLCPVCVASYNADARARMRRARRARRRATADA